MCQAPTLITHVCVCVCVRVPVAAFLMFTSAQVNIKCNTGFVASVSGRASPRCFLPSRAASAPGGSGGGAGGENESDKGGASELQVEEGITCVPGGSTAVVLEQRSAAARQQAAPASGASTRIAVVSRTRLAERGVVFAASALVWPWQARSPKGEWTLPRKCTRMAGFISCLSAPASLAARGDCALPVSPTAGSAKESPLSPGSPLTGATCYALGTHCIGDCRGVAPPVPVAAVVAVMLQGGTGQLRLSLATVMAPPCSNSSGSASPGVPALALATVAGSEAVLTRGAASHDLRQAYAAVSRTHSHRNQLLVRYVDAAARVRVLDAMVNASAVLEEADVRLPLQHPAAAEGRSGWWNDSMPRALVLGFERVFDPPNAAAETLFVTSRRAAAHVECAQQQDASAGTGMAEAPEPDGIVATNESAVALVARLRCRGWSEAAAASLARPGDPMASDAAARDCAGRRSVREAREAQVLPPRSIPLPVPHPQATSCGMWWHVPAACAAVRDCVVQGVNRRWWSSLDPYYQESGMQLRFEYRAPVTRHEHALHIDMHALTDNTTCFVVGHAQARQYAASQNHGEGMCAVSSLMQACHLSAPLHTDASLCPPLALAECRLQPGGSGGADAATYHLTDYAMSEALGFKPDGTPDRFFPQPPPRA